MGIKTLLGGLFLLISTEALACATCGQSFSFTPRTMAISFGFFLLPSSLAFLFWWKVIRPQKKLDESSEPGSPDL